MKYIVTINNNSYEVEVEKGEARLVKTTEVAAAPVTAQIVTTSSVPDTAPATPTPAAPPVTAGEKITAPMPGVILQIKKISDDSVKKGETILILEAMKMENEVIAPRDGVIAQITAVKGASVNTGDVLAVLQ
jgi:biotin carboxyl carrier protein